MHCTSQQTFHTMDDVEEANAMVQVHKKLIVYARTHAHTHTHTHTHHKLLIIVIITTTSTYIATFEADTAGRGAGLLVPMVLRPLGGTLAALPSRSAPDSPSSGVCVGLELSLPTTHCTG